MSSGTQSSTAVKAMIDEARAAAKVRRKPARLRNAILLGSGLGAIASAAFAQATAPNPPLRLRSDFFGYAAGASGRALYTDNINLSAEEDAEDELILSSIFTLTGILSNDRLTGVLLGDLDFSFLTMESDFVVNQNIGAAATGVVVEDLFYVDVSGRTTRALIGDNARFSGNRNAARGQQANVHNFALSPYLYRQFADGSAATLRYRYSQVFIDDSNSDFANGFNNFLNDSRSQEIIASYDSGNLFDRLRFDLTGYASDTTEEGSGVFPDFGYRQASGTLASEYALTRSVSLSGAVGYDEIDTQDATSLFFNENDLSGFFWRAGVTLRPNRRAFARLEYGERFNDDFIDASISYALSNRISLRASANRSFRTRAQGQADRFVETQTQILEFADRLREGGEGTPRGVIDAAAQFTDFNLGQSAQNLGVGVVNQASGAVLFNFDRTTLSVTGRYDDSDFGFRQIEGFGVNARADHQLSRQLSGYVSASINRIDTTTNLAVCEENPALFGIDPTLPGLDPVLACANFTNIDGLANTFVGQVGASYALARNVSAFAEYSYANRFGTEDLFGFDENAISVGITLDF